MKWINKILVKEVPFIQGKETINQERFTQGNIVKWHNFKMAAIEFQRFDTILKGCSKMAAISTRASGTWLVL